eukprot:Opistho-2@78577
MVGTSLQIKPAFCKSEQLYQLQFHYPSAKVDRDSLEKVNSNQRAELNGLVERFRELTFVTAKREGNLKTDLAVAREQVAQLNETVQAKEIELAALLASKQDVWNERNMLMETLGSLQAQLELTNDERATVALQLANATAGKQATDALLSSIRDRLQASTDECAGLRRDLLACRDTLLCKDTEINGFEQAIQAGHTRIADMRTASEDSQKLFSERLISIQRERDAFELKLTESVAAKAALQSDADEIAAALSASVDKLQALQASETCLRHEIEQAKRRAIAAELKSSEDLATATAEITALKLCAETMAAELLCDKAACKSLTSELESTKVEVNRLRNELADALASGAKAECNARAVGREAAARQEETQQRIADLEQQLATIAPILASCQQDHTVARFEELSRLSKEETTLKAVISKLEGENLVLLGKIASLQTELQGRIHELQARLNGAVEAKHFADSALKNSKEECAALSVAVRDLRARLDIKVRELDLAQLPSARQLEITTTVTPSKAPATPSVTPIGTSTPLLKSGNEDYEGSRLSKKAKLRSPSTPPNPMDTTPSIRTARAPKPKRDTASARTPARKGPSGTATRGPRATAPKRDAWVDHDDVWGFDEC